MPMLTVRCSKCKAVIPTGTEMTYDTYRNATFIQNTARCPKCRNLQTWTMDDVDKSVFPEWKKP